MSPAIFRLLAVPTSIALISFLGYGSQVLFWDIEPGPFAGRQQLGFNILMICIFASYLRACFVDPGWVPKGWISPITSAIENEPVGSKQKWCRKCNAQKPPRAHHCKICARCVPKMDHHCPWTVNCVSHRTFPHFFRFLLYSVITMSYLEYALLIRVGVIWAARHDPSYLGPSATQLVFLFVLLVANSMTLFGVGLLFIRNVWCLASNTTTIEGWEIERHENLVRRAKRRGGYLDGPDGIQMRLTHQEFPYDIGIFKNIAQGMTGLFIFWLFPFAPTASNESGLNFCTNGFDDRPWPPPDPDRISHQGFISAKSPGFMVGQADSNPSERLEAFRRRKQADFQRPHYGSKPNREPQRGDAAGGPAWKNFEGERLDDYGVDEDLEFEEDEIPLSELIRRRRRDHLARPSD